MQIGAPTRALETVKSENAEMHIKMQELQASVGRCVHEHTEEAGGLVHELAGELKMQVDALPRALETVKSENVGVHVQMQELQASVGRCEHAHTMDAVHELAEDLETQIGALTRALETVKSENAEVHIQMQELQASVGTHGQEHAEVAGGLVHELAEDLDMKIGALTKAPEHIQVQELQASAGGRHVGA